MARMMGDQVWRGQTMEHTPRSHGEWRRREGRAWRREADLGDEFAVFAAESLEWAEATMAAGDTESWPPYS